MPDFVVRLKRVQAGKMCAKPYISPALVLLIHRLNISCVVYRATGLADQSVRILRV